MAMDSDENVLHEVGIMNSLDHPNIVSVVDFFETPQHYYIVMEYMAGGDVFDRITLYSSNVYTEKIARDLFVLLLRGVQHMVSNYLWEWGMISCSLLASTNV